MTSIAGPQNIKDIYSLLESRDLHVIEETTSLIRDSINASPDPWLIFGIEYYITTGNEIVRDLVTTIRSPHHKMLLAKIDELLLKANTRVEALNIFGDIFRKEPPWIHEVIDSRAFQSMIRVATNDNDIVALTTSLYNLATLLPKVPTQMGGHLHSLFTIYVRLVGWDLKKFNSDINSLNLSQLKCAVYAYFLCLYGMYPSSFTSFLQQYFCTKSRNIENRSGNSSTTSLNPSPSSAEIERNNIFHNHVLPMLHHVRLHPKLIFYTTDMETSKERWRKMEPHDVLADIGDISLDSTENTITLQCSKSPEENLVNINEQSLQSVFLPQSSSNKPKLYDSKSNPLVSSQFQCSDQPASIWSPSMIIGLSTPPPSRSISPAPGLTDSSPQIEGKSQSLRERHLSGEKLRPSSLNLAAARTKASSSQNTPCEKTPTKSAIKFDFGKSASVTNTPTKTAHDKSCYPNLPKSASKHNVSLDKDDIEIAEINTSMFEVPANEKSTEESFVNISYQNISQNSELKSEVCDDNLLTSTNVQRSTVAGASLICEDALDVLNIAQQNTKLPIWSPNEILERQIQLVAETMPANYLEKSSKNVMNLSHFSHPTNDTKSLKTALLQMHCAMLYERHKRQQHTVRGRRLKRKVYECTALEEKNNTLQLQVKAKEDEINQLRAVVKDHANVVKKKCDEHSTERQYFHDKVNEISNQRRILQQENARLKAEKYTDRQTIEDLSKTLQEKDAEIYQKQLQLETHKHNKEVIDKLTNQVMMQQKELLVVGELNNKVTDLTEFSQKYKVVKQAEYDMMKSTYEETLNNLTTEFDQMKVKLGYAEDKLKYLETELVKKKRLLEQQKKYLENVKSLARGQIQSLESKYQAQKAIVVRMETHVMELYSKLTSLEVPSEHHPYSSSRIKPIQTGSKSLTAIATASGHMLGISPQLSPPIRNNLIGDTQRNTGGDKH